MSPPPAPAFLMHSFTSWRTSSSVFQHSVSPQSIFPSKQTLLPYLALASPMSIPDSGSIGWMPAMPVSTSMSKILQILPSVCFRQGTPWLLHSSTIAFKGRISNFSICFGDTMGPIVVAISPVTQIISAPTSIQFLIYRRL